MEQKRIQTSTQKQQQTQEVNAKEVSYEGLDSILDEIDNVLETNAEEFVSSFVQKGGQ